MSSEGVPKFGEVLPEHSIHITEEVQSKKDIVGGVSAECGHTDGEEGDVLEGHQTGYD